MDNRPEPPPEGKLIAEAAARCGISIREASRRAGISYGRWRQIVNGYQNVSPGVYAVVHDAPARTVARMASVVGVQPSQLEEAGRPDAASELRQIQAEQAEQAQTFTPPDSGATSVNAATMAAAADAMAILQEVHGQVDAAKRRARMRDSDAYPAGREIFGDVIEQGLWDLDRDPETREQTEGERESIIAFVRMKARQSQKSPGRPRNAK